ncbi:MULTISPECIES: S26 family signal peptidase [Paracoccus]|uniref:Conjugative transfer signal peptidase TraF n=1 Tax=Paracoccus versutus TaxID=34007 RepID=A0A3D9XCJ3_PARVE|nr:MULTISPECIES: S26 family signal peptidase [Paracoccus]REF68306.1 conjugative transfer signal peptidase TraF [Paracoccus versutus]WGR58969.1 S26 family signal peptidase [Paracoccus versutus]SFY25044.1 conjugation peptidase TraF. Serine peptidase. MEROPS family S26C [Paracoccus pantotrophus]
MTSWKRAAYLAATGLAVLVTGAVSVTEIAPRLIWNASASVPLGLYVLRPVGNPSVGDLVAVDPPEPLARFVTARGYVGPGVPLLKRVAALPGQKVCRVGSAVTVDGVATATALARDSRSRDLPVWRGCRVIGGDEIFLLNPGVRDSLDGRYFGSLPAAAVIGRAIPLWTDAAGDGRFRRPATGAETAPDPTSNHQPTER